MLQQIASEDLQIPKNFQKGEGDTPPLRPLPQDGGPKQRATITQSRKKASHAGEQIQEKGPQKQLGIIIMLSKMLFIV